MDPPPIPTGFRRSTPARSAGWCGRWCPGGVANTVRRGSGGGHWYAGTVSTRG